MGDCGGLAIEARLSCSASFGYKGALPEKSLWKHVVEWQERILHAWKWPPLGQRWVTQNGEGQSLVKEKRFSTSYIWSLEDDRPVRVKVSKEISFTRWATYYSEPYHLFKDGRIKKVHSELYLNVMRIAICQVYCCFLYESFLRLLPGHSLRWAGLPRRPLGLLTGQEVQCGASARMPRVKAPFSSLPLLPSSFVLLCTSLSSLPGGWLGAITCLVPQKTLKSCPSVDFPFSLLCVLNPWPSLRRELEERGKRGGPSPFFCSLRMF